MTEQTEHTYPSNYPPGTHWSIDAAWEILDTLTPGALSIEARSLLAGMIAGRLMRERAALEQSVNLQNHYAQLLNEHDGGERLAFETAQDWVDRLVSLER